MKQFLTLSLVFVLSMRVLAANDPLAWPQFRGPAGSGIAESEKPPVEFGPDKNVKWKVPAPAGESSPIIVGDKLVITAFENDKLYTIAFNRADGKEAWRAEAPAKKIEKYLKGEGSPAASTAATDGQHIVTYFGSCGLFCYDLNGKEQWHYEMPTADTLAGFGTGASPIIADGLVVLVRDEMKGSKIIAIDLATGKPKWEKPRHSICGYSTPVVWNNSQSKQVVTPGFGRMIGYDLASGDEKWYLEGMPASCCTSPVIGGENLFFAGWSPGGSDDTEHSMPSYDSYLKDMDKDKDGAISKEESLNTPIATFFDSSDANKDGKFSREEHQMIEQFMAAGKNSAFALKPGSMGDAKANVVWKKEKGLPYISSAILYKGQYVMVRDQGIVTAYDEKTGDELYQKRGVASGNYYASPVAANGNIYFASLPDGEITVVKGGTSPPEVVAKNPPLGERLAATPAIADNTLYIRTAGHLWAFAE